MIIFGCIDVGDRCWRPNMLATTLRCWWRFWPFSSPTSSPLSFDISIGDLHSKTSPTSKLSHQQKVAKLKNCQQKSPSFTCHKHLCSHFSAAFFIKWCVSSRWSSPQYCPMPHGPCGIRIKLTSGRRTPVYNFYWTLHKAGKNFVNTCFLL